MCDLSEFDDLQQRLRSEAGPRLPRPAIVRRSAQLLTTHRRLMTTRLLGRVAWVLLLGGGLLALVMGVISFGYTEALYKWEELQEVVGLPDNVNLVRSMSVIAPLLAIAGAGMARYRALWGGIALGLAAIAIYMTFNNFFAIFPASMCGLAAILAIAAGRPDEPKSHF